MTDIVFSFLPFEKLVQLASRPYICDSHTYKWACIAGHLPVVKYLVSIGKECNFSMDWASKHGHLDIVKYLDSIRKECTTKAMDGASEYVHLYVVK